MCCTTGTLVASGGRSLVRPLRPSENALPRTGVILALTVGHFPGFGVAQQGPWNTWVNTARRRAGAPEARTPEPYESSLWIVKQARSPSYAPGSDQPPTLEAPPPATAPQRRPARSRPLALWPQEREPTGR